MKRLLLFTHYNKYDQVSDHVVYLLEGIQKYFDNTIIISNSEITDSDKKKLDGLHSKIIIRPNSGYDFAAWRDGMLDMGWDTLSEYDSVTIMNDTCFGPVFSFDPVFESMESKSLDFWGIISHRKVPAAESHSGKTIHEHLQSFFITFNKSVIESNVFKDFWTNVIEIESVHEVIEKYETRLTHLLSKAGFKYEAFFDATDVDKYSLANLTIYSPEKCLEAGMPLVKVKAFTHHRYPRYLLERLEELSDYPLELIEGYFNEYTDPNQQLVILDKMLKKGIVPKSGKQKVGVHLHAFYMDVAEEFISRFKQWPFSFDLFITVSNDDLKEQVSKILKSYDIQAKRIVVLPNRGYAVVPWITVANKYLQDYDVVGHFHTKKDAHMDEWVGKVWTGDLINTLVDPAGDIVKAFASDENLGVVVPDIPTHIRYLGSEMYYNSSELRDLVTATYIRMNIKTKRSIDMDKIIAYIYPYGMMYWYRPDALKPITDLTFSEREVPYGKLPDTTVLHAIERLFVYVSWSKGYDYKIAKLDEYTSEFVSTISVNKQSLIREHTRPVMVVSLKSAIKIKIKRELKKIADRLPQGIKAKILKVLIGVKTQRIERKSRAATVKLFTHELSNTGGPRVAVDLFGQIKNDPTISKSIVPELYVPSGSKIDAHFYNELRGKDISIHQYALDSLYFNNGDIVIMNTIAYSESTFAIILDNLERGIIKHLYLYPHEYVVESYLSTAIAQKISKLMKQKKLTIYTSSVQTQKVYQDFLVEEDEIKLMPNRIDIDESTMFERKEGDFDKINFVVTGTPDARKGELDILYALTSFYFNRYKGNEDKYRDFALTIVGLSDNFRDVYNKLYSDRVRVAAKALGDHVVLYGHLPEEESLEVIKKNNVTILYSLYECLPRVVFDGLAYGHPVIRNDCSGYEEQLIDGVNGWKTRTDDWQGLVNAMDEILDKTKTKNSDLAEMSRESVKIAKKYAASKYVVIEEIKNLIDADN